MVTDEFAAFNRNDEPGAQRHALRFTNLDATLYGLRANLRQQLFDDQHTGRLFAALSASLNRGSRDESDEPLYQQMPWQAGLRIEHMLAGWHTQLDVTWTDEKHRVDPRRLENVTDSYTLVNIKTHYQWQQLQLTLGISNLLDKDYALPLGGVSVADIGMNRTQQFAQLKGYGRSLDVGLQYQF